MGFKQQKWQKIFQVKGAIMEVEQEEMFLVVTSNYECVTKKIPIFIKSQELFSQSFLN